MTAYDDILREFREFRRYTGDGRPGAPTNAPLPVGDPQSGVYNPKKAALRAALGGLAQDLLNGISLVDGALPALISARDDALADIEASKEEFYALYLGAKATDPLVDNEGAPLKDGATYWNTSTKVFRAYDLATQTWNSTRYNFAGAWSAGVNYTADTLVEHEGSIWLSRRTNIGVAPAEGADWRLFLPGVTVADASIGRPKLFTHFERSIPLNLWEFGAVGNDNPTSLIDESAQIASAIAAAAAAGRELYIPGTNYLWGGINLTSAFKLYLEGDHVNRPNFLATQALANAGGRMFRFNRTAHDVEAGAITVPTNIAPNQKKIQLSSVSQLRAGMIISITSSALWYYDNRGVETKGEMHEITRVLPGTNQIEVRDYTRDFYNVGSETLTVRAWWPDRLVVNSLNAIMPAPATAVSTCCFQTEKLYDARMNDVAIEGATFCGWLRQRSLYTRTEGVNIKNIGHSGGVGYGLSDRGCVASQDYGTHGQSMRRLIDYHSGSGIVSRDGLFKDFEMYGGGVEFDGSEFYPDGTVQDYGVGMHGPCENARFVDGIISGVMEGVKVRGRNTEVSGVRFLGRMDSCVAASFGTGLVVENNSYERVDFPSKVSAGSLDNNAQATNFVRLGVSAGVGDWNYAAPTKITDNVANGLRDSFVLFAASGGTILAENMQVEGNLALVRPPSGSTFEFFKVAGAARVGSSKIGPNKVINRGAGKAVTIPTALTVANVSQVGNGGAVETGDSEFMLSMPSDTFAVIKDASKTAGDRVCLKIVDHTGNVFCDLILLSAVATTVLLGAQSPSVVPTATGSALNGTTGVSGNFTIGLTDGDLYMENRTGATRRLRVMIS